MEEVWNKAGSVRDMIGVEIWRLRDAIFPDGDHK